MEHFLQFLLWFFYEFDLLKRALTLFDMMIFMLCYFHAYKFYAMAFDKIRQALSTFEEVTQVLSMWWSGWCSICPIYVVGLA